MKFNVKPSKEKWSKVLLGVLAVLAAASVAAAVLAWRTEVFSPKRQFAQLVLYEGPKPVAAS